MERRRLVLSIDENLINLFKAYCALQGRPMRDVIEELMRQTVEQTDE